MLNLTICLNMHLISRESFPRLNATQVQTSYKGISRFPNGRTCYATLSRIKKLSARIQMIMAFRMRRSGMLFVLLADTLSVITMIVQHHTFWV